MFRIGFGTDVHKLIEGRKLFLGGIEVPHTKGLLGHSDADVLIHAICDALLGAAALGDIGQHFSDTSSDFAGIDSKILLQRVTELLHAEGYEIVNVDATICAQRPKLAPHIPTMRQCLAPLMGISVDHVSIKATTTENLGFEGREEGISAQAVALITKGQ
ncbi:MAG: 2-C-methyl-D-erythritol 2,4-cyclodiphosphate synthase [Bacteroidaceae bacterium]|nr:2-C-methyl-D-erythritol 2,4-cyclodiphosphate synthase [Bacteroidaceae bacterium]